VDWLSTALTHFTDQTDSIWGQVIVPLPQNPTDYQLNIAGLGKGEFVTANCFCRKSILQRIDGFDERFYKAWREDSDLYFTLIEHSARLKFVPEAMILHPAMKAEFGKSIWMQKNNLFEPLLFKKHPHLYRKYAQLPILNMFYAIVILLTGMAISLAAGFMPLGMIAFIGWLGLTVSFIRKRLNNSSSDPQHILEMIVTSIVIPPLAVFWRMVGKYRFKNI
jgi:GT2 family glycosyltransferase